MCCATQSGCTALHVAAGYGRMAVVKYLVEKCQVVITTHDRKGKSPIVYAKYQGHPNVVDYLKAQVKVRRMMKMVMESNLLPFYTGVRSIIVKYLQ